MEIDCIYQNFRISYATWVISAGYEGVGLILILTGSAEHRVEGRLRRQPRGPVARDFERGKGVWRKRRNEKAVKPLKTHKTAKSLIQWS
jgi:hypothetical protein